MPQPSFYWMLHGRIAVPVPHEKWEFQDVAIRRVAEDYVGEIWISTVFLGVDHGFRSDGRPILFETMVFETDDVRDSESLEQYQERYSSWEEAESGHARIVTAVKLHQQYKG